MTRYTTPASGPTPVIPSRSGRISSDGQLMFGKYKGKDLNWVAKNDSGYIRWALEKGILKESDFAPQEVQAEVEDGLGELWAGTPEQYSTTRKIEDHEIDDPRQTIFRGNWFPEPIRPTKPHRR